ncbi:hypothetical protein SA496_14305 [Pseudomonas sp. JS3066]|uniref:hypothetical protein n=1 Tax=Pseudomonas sp. JS3066 TaxID=3090665 RepID=UPI002E7BD29F|nr:hypothetical protein [Pseudomonas sp. JS3066]WVK90918.1 hypothetical protein SA496_14305 [Pseudomonas sp. JS3066]
MNAQVELLSKEAHQALAMLHARAIRGLYSEAKKQESRRLVCQHLRLSLAHPPVAAGERAQQYMET